MSDRAADDPIQWIYLASGRCVGFVRGRAGVARAVVKDMIANDERINGGTIHWRKNGYVLRRPPQKPPAKAKRKRK
jgi:hypothetical protein